MLSIFGSNNRRNSLVAADRANGRTTAQAVQQEPPPAPANLEIGMDIAVRAAQQQTGAEAAALALMQDGLLVCQARVGSFPPAVGVPLNTTVGITAACVRTAEVLYCSDAETDLRVDSCLCREFNLRSILVVPILEAEVVSGVVEVLSPRVDAFNATHMRWLIQLAQFIPALTVNAKSLQTTTLARTMSVLKTRDEETETEQPKQSGDQAVSRQADPQETELAVIRNILQHSDGTATWDEVSQELVSRFRIHENT